VGAYKGDAIVKFSSLTRYAFALASAFLLSSCGGGGASTTPVDPTGLQLIPATAVWYAGAPNTLTIVGGIPPFTVASSEPALLNLPATTDSHTIVVIPNNPSVIDAGIPPGGLPVRTTTITVHSANGLTATSSIQIAQNFLTGYGFTFGATTCQASASPCAGGETAIIFDATTNGLILQDRVFRIERVRGPFQFVDPINSNNQTDAINVVSDHQGRFTVVIRVAAGIPTQVGVIKITDLSSGANVTETFNINGTPATGQLTVIPTSVSLTGPNGTICGFGTFDVLVFDGATPYTAMCPNPQIQVVNTTSTSQPGRFTFNVGGSTTCLTGEQCVITDAFGARTTFTVTTVKGVNPPTTPLTVSPNTLTLACGQTGNVTVVGGNGNYQANSSNSRVTATVSGNTVSITRLTGDVGGPFPTTATISVTDGASVGSTTATVPASCP
jgi:hypothetical protein